MRTGFLALLTAASLWAAPLWTGDAWAEGHPAGKAICEHQAEPTDLSAVFRFILEHRAVLARYELEQSTQREAKRNPRCVVDPTDPFEPHDTVPSGPYQGKCVETSWARPVRTLTEKEADAYGGVEPGYKLVANFAHAGKWWVAKIPTEPDAIEDVIFLKEPLVSDKIPIKHTMVRFRFKEGHEIRLIPQKLAPGGLDSLKEVKIREIVHSADNVGVRGTENSMKDTALGRQPIARHFTSLEQAISEKVNHEGHQVEQKRLIMPQWVKRSLFDAALSQSEKHGYRSMYHLLSFNCVTELLALFEPSNPPSAQTLWKRLKTIFPAMPFTVEHNIAAQGVRLVPIQSLNDETRKNLAAAKAAGSSR